MSDSDSARTDDDVRRPQGFDGIVARLRAAGCVFAEDEATLILEAAGDDHGTRERLVSARVAGTPLEHALGWAEFSGLRVTVGPGVFVPRRRTELLVRSARELARPGAVVLDLCCGSGAVAAALAAGSGKEAEPLEVWASDIDPNAVRSARANLGDERVLEGDLYDALPDTLRGRIDVIVVNAPYVPTEAIATMPPEARLYEAPIALDGGDDGLDVQRRVIAEASEWLAPGGRLLIETSELQAPETTALFVAAGFEAETLRDDEIDATVVSGILR